MVDDKNLASSLIDRNRKLKDVNIEFESILTRVKCKQLTIFDQFSDGLSTGK